MYFDWKTWSIWLMGVIVFIWWFIFPLREFIKLWKEKNRQKDKNSNQ